MVLRKVYLMFIFIYHIFIHINPKTSVDLAVDLKLHLIIANNKNTLFLHSILIKKKKTLVLIFLLVFLLSVVLSLSLYLYLSLCHCSALLCKVFSFFHTCTRSHVIYFHSRACIPICRAFRKLAACQQ